MPERVTSHTQNHWLDLSFSKNTPKRKSFDKKYKVEEKKKGNGIEINYIYFFCLNTTKTSTNKILKKSST